VLVAAAFFERGYPVDATIRQNAPNLARPNPRSPALLPFIIRLLDRPCRQALQSIFDHEL
jgi:hypothetical protein